MVLISLHQQSKRNSNNNYYQNLLDQRVNYNKYCWFVSIHRIVQIITITFPMSVTHTIPVIWVMLVTLTAVTYCLNHSSREQVRDILEVIIIFLRTMIIAMLLIIIITLRTRTVKVIAVVVEAVAVTMLRLVIIYMLEGLNDQLVHNLNRIVVILLLRISRHSWRRKQIILRILATSPAMFLLLQLQRCRK